MRQATFFPIAAVLYAGFGLGLVSIPDPFMSVYGVSLDVGGALMARILGSALIGFAILFWLVRKDSWSSVVKGICIASLIYNLVDLPIVTMATVNGIMIPVGWTAVGLHAFLAAGFALVLRSEKSRASVLQTEAT